MFNNYSIQQLTDVIIYSIFVLCLFSTIYFVSVKLSNYYIQETDKKEKLNKLRKNYHRVDKNYYKKVA